MSSITTLELPYGIHDLDPEVLKIPGEERRVRCFIKGCQQELVTPTRKGRGEVCPEHGIRCHQSSTYSYLQPGRNIIASPKLFTQRIIGHPFKFESHRLGAERSEDALSWNVFRSLQEAGQLAALAELITGESSSVEPFLFLWGICLTRDACDPWHLLVQARQRFESNLPVVRPLTEPDIALHLPGRYLILIEAKFTSKNTYYESGPRSNDSSLTLDELLGIYQCPELELLNLQQALQSHRVYYQLWRNTVFAEWMARLDHPRTRAFHVNLVLDGRERESAAEFQGLINGRFKERFQRMTWEQIYARFRQEPKLDRLRSYFETKTAGLKKVFHV